MQVFLPENLKMFISVTKNFINMKIYVTEQESRKIFGHLKKSW